MHPTDIANLYEYQRQERNNVVNLRKGGFIFGLGLMALCLLSMVLQVISTWSSLNIEEQIFNVMTIFLYVPFMLLFAYTCATLPLVFKVMGAKTLLFLPVACICGWFFAHKIISNAKEEAQECFDLLKEDAKMQPEKYEGWCPSPVESYKNNPGCYNICPPKPAKIKKDVRDMKNWKEFIEFKPDPKDITHVGYITFYPTKIFNYTPYEDEYGKDDETPPFINYEPKPKEEKKPFVIEDEENFFDYYSDE